jgi:hypothetical protein
LNEKKRCSMCNELYVETDGLPPATLRFFGKDFYADLCFACGARVAAYVKDYRRKKSWSQYVS